MVKKIPSDRPSCTISRRVFIAGAASATCLATTNAGDTKQPATTFRVWAAGDSHVPSDIKHRRESLALAIRQSEGFEDGAPPFEWDIMVDTGDLSASQYPPTDEDGRILVRQYGALLKHYREDVYNVAGNHDGDYFDQGVGTWFARWADPLGQHTKHSSVDPNRRRFPVEGTAQRYRFVAGNVLFLMMSDYNSCPAPVGRGHSSEKRHGGHPAGAVTRETFEWWKRQVLDNQDKIIVSVHHHVLRGTTTRSGYDEGKGFHGPSGGVECSSYLAHVVENPDPDHFQFTTSTPQSPGPFEQFLDEFQRTNGRPAIDVWIGGHSHAMTPHQVFNDKGLTEQRWGVTFLQVSALTMYHGGGTPQSRLLTFTVGSDQLQTELYVHESGRKGKYPIGWYQPAVRTIALRHPLQTPTPDPRPPRKGLKN